MGHHFLSLKSENRNINKVKTNIWLKKKLENKKMKNDKYYQISSLP